MSGFLGTLIRRLRRPGALAGQVRDGYIYLDQLSGKVRVADPLGGDRALEQTGGGSSDHATLTHLAWSASAHTGTASQLAGFSGGGAAAYYAIGSAGGVQAYSATLDALVANGTPGATGLAVLLAATGSAARTTIGVVIGTDVQAYNASLAAIAAGTWTGATSITVLGTVGTGVWQGTAVAVAYGGTGSGTAAGARTNLGLAIGSNVQAWDADLDALAALGSNGLIVKTGAGTVAARTIGAGSAQVVVTNGDGVAGPPSIDLGAVGGDSTGTILAMVNTLARGLRDAAAVTFATAGTWVNGGVLRLSAGTIIAGAALAPIFGDGSDGALVYDGAATILGMAPSANVYTLTRDIYASSLTLNSGISIKTAGFRIYCSGALTFTDGTSVIFWDGTAASGITGGGFISGGSVGQAGSSSGATGRSTTGAGSGAGSNAFNFGSNGAAGGTAGGANTGGAGSTATAPDARCGSWRALDYVMRGYRLLTVSGAASLQAPGLSTAGGAGGCDVSGGGTASSGGGGGGAGMVAILAATIVGAGVVRAQGGAGGNAVFTGAGKAGGGGGGTGGIVDITTTTPTLPCTVSVAGGAAGTGANGGANGGTGTTGVSITRLI